MEGDLTRLMCTSLTSSEIVGIQEISGIHVQGDVYLVLLFSLGWLFCIFWIYALAVMLAHISIFRSSLRVKPIVAL